MVKTAPETTCDELAPIDWTMTFSRMVERRRNMRPMPTARIAMGMAASKTLLPVLGVPIRSSSLNGVDSLLSIVQMPKGIPVGTLAIGKAGAANAALLTAAILANEDEAIAAALDEFRSKQTDRVLGDSDPRN